MIEPGGKAAILIGMAKTAELAGNNVEAISYYNRVLEDDPTASEAWLGKGRAAGWMSTLANIRLKETTVAFGHAIAAAGDAREEIARQALEALAAIGSAVKDMGWQHYFDFPGVPGVWETNVAVQTAVLDAQLSSDEWEVDHPAALALTIATAKQLLDHGGAPHAESYARAMFDHAVRRMRTIDPAYVPPPLAETTIVDRVAADTKKQIQQVQSQNDLEAAGYISVFVLLVIVGLVILLAKSQ